MNGAAGLRLTVKVSDDWDTGYNIDLNGIFLDYQSGGNNRLFVAGERANNLSGARDADGNEIFWDVAKSLGSQVGGADGITDWTEGSAFFAGLTLEVLDGANIGIRATSTGPEGEKSLKLIDVIDVPDDNGGDPPNHFPEWAEPSISHVTFYFSDTDPWDTRGEGSPGNWLPDGVTTIKIDVGSNDGTATDPGGINDLDNWLQDALAFIATNYPGLDVATLFGASIKGGQQEIWYSLDNDPNNQDTPPSQWAVTGNNLDGDNWTVSVANGDYVFA